ncbi:MAG: hypothetical protein COB81_09215 [Flavobacteriaceae bacterium]|nr:MAG: hypothetical protein COB81_09215 [Flavobacteriaceae bacterium]
MNYLNDGGPFFMYSLLLLLIIILLLIVQAFRKKTDINKLTSTIASLGLFSLVLGFLAQIIGFIGALDVIAMAVDVSPVVLATGLKISYIAPVFGILIFFTAQIGKLILIWSTKES